MNMLNAARQVSQDILELDFAAEVAATCSANRPNLRQMPTNANKHGLYHAIKAPAPGNM